MSSWPPTSAGARRLVPTSWSTASAAGIMFPTADARGRVRGFGARTMGNDDGPKYLNTAEGEVYRKREVLYGIAAGAAVGGAESGRMILCEGYTDVLALHQAGVRNAVGIMGTSLTDEQVAELVRVVKVLELCLDADNAGPAGDGAGGEGMCRLGARVACRAAARRAPTRAS